MAYTVPLSRTTSFSAGVLQGVVGGIPSFAGAPEFDIMDYGGVEGGGATTNDAAILAAYNAAVAAVGAGNAVITIPSGVYTVSSPGLPWNGRNKIVRGAGSKNTTLRVLGGTGFALGGSSDYGNPGNPSATIIGGLTQGSTSLQVADASLFTANRMARVKLVNEAETPIISTYGYDRVRSFTVFVTAINTTTDVLTLSQPIPQNYPAAATAGAIIEQLQLSSPHFYGLEGVRVDGADSGGGMTFGVAMAGCVNSWFRDVVVTGQNNHAFFVSNCQNAEVRRCIAEAGRLGSSNTSGLLHEGSSFSLVEDGVFASNNPAIEVNHGSTACVFAYNYCGTAIINTNHGPHNAANLYEGNICAFFQPDGYFGSVSDDTLFRNWIRSNITASLKRFTRRYNIVGNIVGIPGETYADDYSERWGDPNMGSEISNGLTVQPSVGTWWHNAPLGVVMEINGVLTERTDDQNGVLTLEPGGGAKLQAHIDNGSISSAGQFGFPSHAGGVNFLKSASIVGDVVTINYASTPLPALDSAVIVVPSPVGFQERDLDVSPSVLRKGNYYVWTGNIPSPESLEGDSLLDSSFRSSAPSSFGDLTYPPFDPASVGTPSIADIPAGYFALNNAWPDDSAAVATPTFTPTAGSFGSAQSVTITCATAGATIHYTTDGSAPTTASPVYSAPIAISVTTTLKAIAVKDGMDDSAVRTGVFTITATSQVKKGKRLLARRR